jgi:DNA polymerase III epsilon subunit-like protein
MTLFRSPLLVLDFETTGFQNQLWSRAIELAAVVLDPTGHEIATFESLILPDILDGRAAGALAVNHITHDMLATAPTTEAVAQRFHDWYNGLTEACGGRGPYCTSFNIPFDRVFAERMGLEVRGWAGCVMDRSMKIMGPAGVLRPGRYGQPWLYPKLSVAAEFFGVAVVGDMHRALTDTRVAAGIAKAIVAWGK